MPHMLSQGSRWRKPESGLDVWLRLGGGGLWSDGLIVLNGQALGVALWGVVQDDTPELVHIPAGSNH